MSNSTPTASDGNSSKNSKAKLIQGDVSKTLVKLTIPMIVGIIAIVGFGLVDSYFIGLLGTEELAVVGFTFPVGMVLTNIAIGLGVGVASVLSRTIGGGNFDRAQHIATDSLWLAIVLVTIMCVVGVLTIDPLFKLLGATDDLLPLIREYMEVYYFSIPFLVIPIVGNSAIRATGDTFTPGMIMVVAAIGNAIFDPLLIFGLWGFPELGIRGAAWATLIAWMFAAVVALWILYKREGLLAFYLPKMSDMFANWKEVLSIGIPAAAAYSLGPVVVAAIVAIVAEFGKEAVAGYGVVVRIRSVALIVALALSSALPVFVGQNWGAEKFGRVEEGIRFSQKFVVISQLFVAILLAVFAVPIAEVFSQEPLVIDIIKFMLYVLPVTYIGIGWGILTSSAFNAINMPMKGMTVNAIRFVVLMLPLAWFGSRYFAFDGLVFGMALANMLAGIIAFIWIRKVTFSNHVAVEAAQDLKTPSTTT